MAEFDVSIEWEESSEYISSIWVSFDLQIDTGTGPIAPNGNSKNQVGAAVAQAIMNTLQNIASEGEVVPNVLVARRYYTATENITVS